MAMTGARDAREVEHFDGEVDVLVVGLGAAGAGRPAPAVRWWSEEAEPGVWEVMEETAFVQVVS